jgi:hypothetical protein
MSRPVFDDIFRFHGRRNRRSCILFTLGAWLLMLALTFHGPDPRAPGAGDLSRLQPRAA